VHQVVLPMFQVFDMACTGLEALGLVKSASHPGL
jgi:hypothetical protein